MSDSDDSSLDLQKEVLDRVAGILAVLSSVKSRDFTARLPTDLPETHPVGALYFGINQTIASLADVRERSETYQRDLEDKLATIEQQQNAIRELSTPVIEVWQGVLCLPIVGVMDSVRSAEMTEALLRATAEKKARCVIIDITGIDVMDTGAADHFMRMARAVGLLGARCYLSGISPALAHTIVSMGLDFSGVVTYRNLRAALQSFVLSMEQSDQMFGGNDDEVWFRR